MKTSLCTASDLALNVRHDIKKTKTIIQRKTKETKNIYNDICRILKCHCCQHMFMAKVHTDKRHHKIMTASFHAVHGHDFQEFQYIPGMLHNKALLKYITSVSVSVWVPAYTLRSVQVKYTRGHCPCVCVKCRFNATSPALLQRYSTLGV